MTPVKQKRRFNWAGESTKKSQEAFRVFQLSCFRDEKFFAHFAQN
jgi:hypothetical protein